MRTSQHGYRSPLRAAEELSTEVSIKMVLQGFKKKNPPQLQLSQALEQFWHSEKTMN